MTEYSFQPAPQEQPSSRKEFFATSKGSQYYLLSDGRTQRFKAALQEWHQPQDIIVFVPSYQVLLNLRPSNMTEADFQGMYGINETQFVQDILEMLHDTANGKRKWRASIVNQDGIELRSNAEKSTAKQLFLKFQSTSSAKVVFIPVSAMPRMEYQPFDKRWFVENGSSMSSQHLGNKIVSISDEFSSGK
ncbi:MAG: hypothetical protein QG639_464 [Patescibacteria group bacterium]|nr:hypothetical protein [Patescibacteria group bacterium]